MNASKARPAAAFVAATSLTFFKPRLKKPAAVGGISRAIRRHSADSNEAARVYRAYSAHRSNLMPPTSLI